MAITYQGIAPNASGSLPNTLPAFSEAVNTNDLIVVFALIGGNNTAISPSVADNLNSGGYTQALYVSNVTNFIQIGVFYKVCNASGSAGTTVVTVSGSGGLGNGCIAVHYNGFVHTPTLILADCVGNTGHSTSATGTSFNNSQTNELLLAGVLTNNGDQSATSSGWTTRSGASGSSYYVGDQQQSTSGNAISFSNTLSATDYWGTGIVGFYDAPSSNTAIISWLV